MAVYGNYNMLLLFYSISDYMYRNRCWNIQ